MQCESDSNVLFRALFGDVTIDVSQTIFPALTSASPSLADRLWNLDSQFSEGVEQAVEGRWFRTVDGDCPVLVSAPHACVHRREGQDKMQEEYTGAIALYLAETCNCSAIVTTRASEYDPNWDEISDYKTAVKTLVQRNAIQLLIDLHGMTSRHGMGVAVGTMRGRACCADIIVPHFIDKGFIDASDVHANEEQWRRLVVDHPRFTGGLVNHTVTRFASQQLNIKAVQIELASQVRVVASHITAPSAGEPRDYYGHPAAIEAAVGALQSLTASFS